MDPEEAKETVGEFLRRARERWLDEADAALVTIANLRWWEIWKARDIAEKALGIGKYWNEGFKP